MIDIAVLIDRATKALEGVTPGPWDWHRWDGVISLHAGENAENPVIVPEYDYQLDQWRAYASPQDASFIAESRDLVPELLAALLQAKHNQEVDDYALDTLTERLERGLSRLDDFHGDESWPFIYDEIRTALGAETLCPTCGGNRCPHHYDRSIKEHDSKVYPPRVPRVRQCTCKVINEPGQAGHLTDGTCPVHPHLIGMNE